MDKPDLYLSVTWEDFHRHAIQLARLLRRQGEWKAVAGISRGGLIPATIIARELDIRLVGVVGIASYHEYHQQGDLQVLQRLNPDILAVCPDGAGCVVVDDLVDTGKTFREVAHMYPLAHRAAVFAKEPVLHVDTHFLTMRRDVWIYLPWDTQPETLQLRPTLLEELAQAAKRDDVTEP